MARKNANTSPGVWLGLLLVLVANSLALSNDDETITKLGEFPDHDDSSKVVLPASDWDMDPTLIFPNNVHKLGEDDAKYIDSKKQKDELNDVKKSAESADQDRPLKKSGGNEGTKTLDTSPEPFSNETKPGGTTIAIEKNLAADKEEKTVEATPKSDEGIKDLDVHNYKTDSTIFEESQNTAPNVSKVISSATNNRELEFAEEHADFEDHTSSELAEATTPSSNSTEANQPKISRESDKNIENFDLNESDDRHSLENDTKVNHYLKNGTREHQAETFKNDTHPTSLKIREEAERDIAIDNTTPYYSNFKPRGRTISTTGDNDLSKKMLKNSSVTNGYQTTSDTIMRIFPKKSVSLEKPNEFKPYPYHKSETKFAENTERTENSTEVISAYNNTIGRRKTDDNVSRTEPSVLVENSVHQLKPVHNKRSGNLTRVTTAATDDLASINATATIEVTPKTIVDIGNRSQINNDVPQDKPNNLVTTERTEIILSEVTENNIETIVEKINRTFANFTAPTPMYKQLSEQTEVTAGDVGENSFKPSGTEVVANFNEKIETVTNGSTVSNEIQAETNESKITMSQFNVIEQSTEYSILAENLSTSTEIDDTPSVSNTTDKLVSEMHSSVSSSVTFFATTESANESSTFRSTETNLIADNVTITEDRESTESITVSPTSQTTNVEYVFVELTTVATDFTISQDNITNSENTNVTSESANETLQTTESQGTIIIDEPIDQNHTTLITKMETATSESQPSVTFSFETTETTPNSNTEATTMDDATDFPVSDSSSNTVTDDYNQTIISSTTKADNASHARIDVTTDGQSNNSEETTTTTMTTETDLPTEQPTPITNIEVIVSSEDITTAQTVAQGTTPQTQINPELPEFAISNTDVTLYVRIVMEGSWSDVCLVLSNLRLSLANLLAEGTGRTVLPRNIILHQTQCTAEPTSSATVTPILLYVVDDNGDFDYTMTEILPSLYKQSAFAFPLMIHSVEKVEQTDNNNAIAVVAVSSVAFICLVLLAGLLFIMRKRQTRFNYGERCRPVSLDAFRVDSVSAYNSVRRKDLTRASKRSYGNPAFEDSSVTPSHPLNFAGLSSFCNDTNAITEEFSGIPQVTARMDELPAGAEVKNRYANVAPLPETRVLLQKINNEPLTEYINASYVRGPKNATKYYIACQAPMESTVSDFWRMIWEQQSKVIIMLTDIVENGVEKCVEYIPPSEVTDCHRLYGDYQVTLKKREAKEKYAISTLHLKNLENNTYREVSHIWYLWPTNGVPSNGTGLIAILLEARALQRGAPGPIVMHCSPGTGRTGTLIALDLGIRQYEITRTIDVPRVVYTIRRDRAGAVQTKEQYAFIYKALNLYAAKLAGGALESM